MIFSIVILAMSLSLDALSVGLSYGMRKIKVPLSSRIVICFFSIIYSGIALGLGKSLSNILLPYISKLIGIGILILIGIWIIMQSILNKDDHNSNGTQINKEDETLLKIAIRSLGITIQVIKNPAKCDVDRSGTIDINESLLLGFALSVDAIGVSIGSALAGFYSMLLPFVIGLFQLICLYIGLYSGEKFSVVGKVNKKLLSILPGIILICLAIMRI